MAMVSPGGYANNWLIVMEFFSSPQENTIYKKEKNSYNITYKVSKDRLLMVLEKGWVLVIEC